MFKRKSSNTRRNEWIRRSATITANKEFKEWDCVLVNLINNEIDYSSEPVVKISLTDKEMEVANNFLKGSSSAQIYIKENGFKCEARKRKLI